MYRAVNQAKNHVDHIILILDGSGSMGKHHQNLVQVVDNQTRYLAEKYKQTEQETRISVFWFSGRYEFECLVYDMDVLRVPSIHKLYRTENMTALIDASIKTIDDLLKVPTQYGDHAFLVYLLTDGLENHSAGTSSQLSNKLRSLPENWTFAGFVPDAEAKRQLEGCGVPAANIAVWDASSSKGIDDVGKIIRTTTDQFKTNRAVGIRGTKSLFEMNTVSSSDIVSKLTPLGQSNYRLLNVLFTQRADNFIYDQLGRPLRIGETYYELMKKETIQPQKNIAILYNGKVYVGDARSLLGLPDYKVEVNPNDGKYKGYKIFVQSTAPNRNLIGGTQALVIL